MMFFRTARRGAPSRAVARFIANSTAVEALESRRLLSGVPGSQPAELATAYGNVFFTAHPDDFGTGGEVFRTDGTEAGTFMVKDVASGINGSSGRFYTPFKGAVYFSAEGPPYVSEDPGRATGTELWKTDGTPEGTSLVKDIAPGMDSSMPYNPVAVGDTLFFEAGEREHGRELWKTDGTPEGTVLVKDLNPGPGSSVVDSRGVSANGLFFFVTGGYEHGPVRLWRSDGTEAGTYVLKDIAAKWDGKPPIAAVGGTVYFVAQDPAQGRELWKSDGTVAGTRLVKDINPGTGGSYPTALVGAGGRVYFAAGDGTDGREVWTSDGTAAGTHVVSDVQGPGGTLEVDALADAGDGVVFGLSDPFQREPTQVWRSDGTAGGTTLAGAIPDSVGSPLITVAGGKLFVTQTTMKRLSGGINDFRMELWSAAAPGSGGAAGDLHLLRSFGNYYSPPAVLGNLLIFGAEDSATGQELWRSDGTVEGTTLVKDINRGGRPAMAGDGLFFYNNSAADGNDPAANARDDAAIAKDKMPLWPNFTATEENISNYSRGINGVMINMSNLPAGGTLSADDFILEVGGEGGSAASNWRPAPTPAELVTRSRGNGGTRVTITWPDRAIYNTWLRVVVKPTADTGILAPKAYYFGHLAGDGGGMPAAAGVRVASASAANSSTVVDAWDVSMTARARTGAAGAVDSPFDYNKDGRVNATDLAIVRSNYRRSLALMTAPSSVTPVGAGSGGDAAVGAASAGTAPQRRALSVRRSVLE